MRETFYFSTGLHQAIRGLRPRDYIPVLLEVQYDKYAGSLSPMRPNRLNGGAMLASIFRGAGTGEFLRDVTQQLRDEGTSLGSRRRTTQPMLSREIKKVLNAQRGESLLAGSGGILIAGMC